MRLHKALTAVVVLTLIATLAFIWGNSLESVQESGVKSGNVFRIVKPLLERFVGKGNATDHIVRKLAHFVEYSALGCELALLVILRRKVCIQAVVNCLSAGLAAAVTDEALQLLSDRGSQISDVLLDLGGAAAGTAFILLIYDIAVLAGSRRKAI
jgi:VanZ family protein